MTDKAVLIEIDDAGTGILTLNKPEVHNAFDDVLIAELTAALKKLEDDPAVRVVVLASQGKSFSAGADLNWMRRMADYSHKENFQDAMALAELLRTLNFLRKPTIALVQGAAYGGGVGLIACCDIVIATDQSAFALTEVKLGIIPAVISPYVVAAIGARQARRYLITGERFNADTAKRIGLIHRIVGQDQLGEAGRHMLEVLLKNGPEAMVHCKDLIFAVDRPIDEPMIRDTAERIADRRASDEGKDGISSFLDKRKPKWIEE